jgi:hypothetical protein
MKAPVKAGRESRMREPHEKGIANHLDPESCADAGNRVGEALTGAPAGQAAPVTAPRTTTAATAPRIQGAHRSPSGDHPILPVSGWQPLRLEMPPTAAQPAIMN